MPKPSITPQLLAELTEAAPNRLRKKIEKKPDLASTYTWSNDGDAWIVETGSETVTFSPSDGALSDLSQVVCTCLLAPKCLHILASANTLTLSDTAVTQDAPMDEVEPKESSQSLVISAEQREAAALMHAAAAAVLDYGAAHARMTVVAELLRAVHQCRVTGLHRAAAAGLRVAESIRSLRGRSQAFDLGSMSSELLDALETCHILTESGKLRLSPKAWVGTARRKYRDIGGMRLYGLCCEPVVAKTGYSGVVAYFMNADGDLWTLSDVMPGESSRVPGAYVGGVSVGDVSASPRDLSRGGLFLQSGTGSADGRLGSGKQVKAVTAAGTPWDEGLGVQLWDTPLDTQLDRAWATLGTPPLEQKPGGDFLFFNATVVGAHEDALVVEVEANGVFTLIRCTAPYNNADVKYVANMRLLARAPGLAVRVIGRVQFDRPSTVKLIAISPWDNGDDEAPKLQLPQHWNHRCNIGLDVIEREFLTDAETHATRLGWQEPVIPDPLLRLRQRLQRVAYGGRMTLRPSVLDDVNREAVQLSARLLPNAGHLLRALGEAAQPKGRDMKGELKIDDVFALANAWHLAATFERAATRSIQRQLFL